MNGAVEETRTLNIFITSEVRYQLRHGGRNNELHPINNHNEIYNFPYIENGRRDKIRTCDPLIPNQIRYQTALLSENGCPGGARSHNLPVNGAECWI